MDGMETYIFLSVIALFVVSFALVLFFGYIHKRQTVPFYEFSPVDEKCPIELVDSEGFTICKGNVLALVLELEGQDYSGLSDEERESFFDARRRFWEGLPPTVTTYLTSFRVRVQRRMDTDNYAVPHAGRIAKKWAETFTRSFRTRHFMVFVSQADSNFDQFKLLAQRLVSEQGAYDEMKDELRKAVKDASLRLKAFKPTLLKGDRVARFWAWQLNGTPTAQKLPSNGQLNGLLGSTGLVWERGKSYQKYLGRAERYSAWIIIKAPANGTSDRLMEKIMQAHVELAVFQTYYVMSRQAGIDETEKRLANVAGFSKRSQIREIELSELAEKLAADEFKLSRSRWALEVFGNTIDQLEKNVSDVRGIVENQGWQTAREMVNMEALFWSRFPGMANFNPRTRPVTTGNAAHLSPWPSVGEGLPACSWGSALTFFRTLQSTVYSFTFHISTAYVALGNALVIGGTGSGKTVLINFLEAMALKYPNFRIANFDRLHGQKVFTNFMQGSYISTEQFGSLEMNPLHLDLTNPNHKAFAANFVSMLVKAESQADVDKIAWAVDVISKVPKEDRNLLAIADALGVESEGSIRQALSKWLPASADKPEGIYGTMFNGRRDALSFQGDSPVVTFDMTTLLEQPDILGPMAYYMFYKILLAGEAEEGGYIVFVDEMPRFIANPYFGSKIETLLQEIRKTDGVFIGACQDLPRILDHNLAPVFRANIGTFLLFPEPGAKREHYIDGLGLNEAEFEWIKGNHPRQVMLKRKTGESVILDIDLEPLGDALKIFDSSKDAARTLNRIQRMHPSDWQEIFLAS